MANTKAGGEKFRARMIKVHGSEENWKQYMRDIASKGGKNSSKIQGNAGGFAFPLLCDCDYSEELHKKAACSGSKGGLRSRRGKIDKGE